MLHGRGMHVLNGCQHMQLHTCHTCTTHAHVTKTTVDYLIANEVGLPLITNADVVDRPYRAMCKNFHAHLLLHLDCKPPQRDMANASGPAVQWVPGSEELWQGHTKSRQFVEGL